MAKINKTVINFIEYELKNYPKYKKELEELKDDIIYQTIGNKLLDDMPKENNNSSLVEMSAIKIILDERIKRLTSLIYKLNIIFKEMDNEKFNIIVDYYFEKKTRKRILHERNICERTFYYWREEVLKQIAIELGLISVQ